MSKNVLLTTEQVNECKATLSKAQQLVADSDAFQQSMVDYLRDHNMSVVFTNFNKDFAAVANLADTIINNPDTYDILPTFDELKSNLSYLRDVLSNSQAYYTLKRLVPEIEKALSDSIKQVSVDITIEEKVHYPIIVKVGNQTLTFGQAYTLIDEDKLDYQNASTVQNDTYLHDSNINQALTKGYPDYVEDALNALESNGWTKYPKNDIRSFCQENDVYDIPSLVDNLSIYKDFEDYNENYVYEQLFAGMDDPSTIDNCFDYDKYWNKYGQYYFTQFGNTIIEN